MALRAYCAAALLLLVAPLHAQDRGLAWQISLDGTEAYALGSLHLADQSFYPLNSIIMTAFEQSEVLLVEADDSNVTPEQQQAILKKYAFYPQGQSIHDELSPELIEQMRTLFLDFGVGLERVQHYRPGMIGVTLSVLQAQTLGYSAEYGLDNYFIERARFKKKITEIETFESQMKLLSELPSDEAVLKEAFFDMTDFKAMWHKTMAAWKAGDAQAMYDIAIGQPLLDSPELATYYDMLFFDRNVTMAKALKQCMQRAKCFILVGAGHLVGRHGVLDLLQQEGAKVTQLD